MTTDAPARTPLLTREQIWAIGISFMALLLVALGIYLKMIAPYLISLAMGGIVAVLTMPLHTKLTQRGMKPTRSALLITLGIMFLIAGPLAFCVNTAIDQAVVLSQNLIKNREDIAAWLRHVASLPVVMRLIPDQSALHDQIVRLVQQLGATLTNMLVQLASSLPATIIQVLLSILTMYYGLLDGRRFLDWISERDTLDPDVEARLVASVRDTTVSSVLASIVSAMIQAVIVFIGCLLLEVPAPFLVLLLTFIASWIPLLGTALVTLPIVVYLFFRSGVYYSLGMLLVSFLCGASDNVTRPWILRGSSAMHPLVGLLAIFGGLQLFGFYGVFIGPIFTGFVLTLLELWPMIGRRLGLLIPRSA